MVWGTISYQGAGKLVFNDGIIDKAHYLHQDLDSTEKS